jgi:selenide, water dikinase
MENMDDAGVYRITHEIALVQTVDFFYPMVNDPRMNGRIAAANSLSDIWAMGATAHTAMNVLAYPPGLIPAEIIGEMLAGGSDKLVEASVSLVGGHTMEQEDLLYGMSATGTVHPDHIKTNTKARAGDAIILTKALGTGVYGNVMMKAELTPEQYRTATDSMSRLNMYAANALKDFSVSAMTDVTGFGLLGHALPVVRSSGLTAFILDSAVPVLPDMKTLQQEYGTKGVCKVTEYVDEFLTVQEGVSPSSVSLFAEAETSGGLLVFIHPDDSEKALKRIRENGDEAAAIIGYTEEVQVKNEYLKVLRA